MGVDEWDQLEDAGLIKKLLAHRALRSSVGLVVKFGFLAWMLGIMFLYWLRYGPGLRFIGRQLGTPQVLQWGREFLQQLQQFFTARYVF